MGEIAEAMLSGKLCSMCGIPLCGECVEMGIPMYCSRECAKEQNIDDEDIDCRICQKQTKK